MEIFILIAVSVATAVVGFVVANKINSAKINRSNGSERKQIKEV